MPSHLYIDILIFINFQVDGENPLIQSSIAVLLKWQIKHHVSDSSLEELLGRLNEIFALLEKNSILNQAVKLPISMKAIEKHLNIKYDYV